MAYRSDDHTYREIAGPNGEPLPLDEELLVLGNLPAADEEDFDDAPEQLQSYNPKPTPPASGYDRHAPLSAQLPPRGNFPVDPPGVGRWPRRLLWMPKSSGQMLSLERTPGNVYTGIGANGAEVSAREPRYNAISYTWGRYWLDQPNLSKACRRLRKVRGIGVQGVTWNVPRIDPARFTAEMFEKVLWETSKVKPETCLVWVDVACIDQEDRAVQGLEIGRQGRIFRSAETVTVWLHEHESSALRKVVETLKEQRDTCGRCCGTFNFSESCLMNFTQRWIRSSKIHGSRPHGRYRKPSCPENEPCFFREKVIPLTDLRLATWLKYARQSIPRSNSISMTQAFGMYRHRTRHRSNSPKYAR